MRFPTASAAMSRTQLKLFDTWYADWSKLPGAVQTYKAA
jgi:hypothetical protein